MSVLSTPEEWHQFLTSYADAARAAEWPGNAAAPEANLLTAEKRLGIKLPSSYRAFLSASNGWLTGSETIPRLRPVQEIRWFKREHGDWVRAYTESMRGTESLLPAEQDYFNYSAVDPTAFDARHLGHTLCISDEGDSAVLLLNPMVIWPDGEWETWFFANWFPGASRYRSFADWMRKQLAELLDKPFVPQSIPGELPAVYLDGPAKSNRRLRPREEMLTLDEALKKLASKTRTNRIKAVRHLYRIGGPRVVSRLLDVLRNDGDDHVRSEAAQMLGRMRAPEAVDWLIALTSEESRVTSNAIEALGNFRDEASAQCLFRLVAEDGPSAGVAVHALSKRKDARPVPLLVNKLISQDPEDQHTGNIAGRYLAMFEGPGCSALELLMDHEDVEIRSRVINGISDLACLAKDRDIKRRARELLKRRLQNEPDESLRHALQIYLSVAGERKAE